MGIILQKIYDSASFDSLVKSWRNTNRHVSQYCIKYISSTLNHRTPCFWWPKFCYVQSYWCERSEIWVFLSLKEELMWWQKIYWRIKTIIFCSSPLLTSYAHSAQNLRCSLRSLFGGFSKTEQSISWEARYYLRVETRERLSESSEKTFISS